jgi:hypothetical protein
MSANSKDTKTPTPEEIAMVFSYLQKFLVEYVKQNNHTEFKETIPIDDQENQNENVSSGDPNVEHTETGNESKNNDNAKPSTNRNYSGRRYYGNNGYNRSYYNGYRKSYYNGNRSYSGVPRKPYYRKDNYAYSGVPGQEDPQNE